MKVYVLKEWHTNKAYADQGSWVNCKVTLSEKEANMWIESPFRTMNEEGPDPNHDYDVLDLECSDHNIKNTVKDGQKIIEPMKQYHFERDKFCEIFTHTFGEDDTIDFINGMFGTKKDHSIGFDYQTSNFKCFWIDEDYHILDLETGVLIVWYKGLHLGRINRCSSPDFTLEDFEKMLIKLHTELVETYGANHK